MWLSLRSNTLALLAAKYYRRLPFLLILIASTTLVVPGEYNLNTIIDSGKTALSITNDDDLAELKDVSAGIRLILITTGYNYFLEKPLLGHGSKTFRERTVLLGTNLSPHNTFVLVLVEVGALGLILFLYIIYLTYRDPDLGNYNAVILFTVCMFADLLSEHLFPFLIAASLSYSVKNRQIN